MKICVAYKYNGEVIEEFPASLKVLHNVNQFMKKCLAGQRILQAVRSLDELPVNARHYVERVSQLTGIPFPFSLSDLTANKQM